MKYLIQDSEEHTLGEINKYFRTELAKTNLIKEDIIIEKPLQVKLATMELDRIFDENGMSVFMELDVEGMHLKHTSNLIEFSDNEIQSRFNDVIDSELANLKNK